ncbi:hypothetical protein [Alicyclobacillus sp. ALC3]|uniref:hypothetical protein n=1 Tax=Alicyclobacillus sp. ALC3 TaxID=2796143 RepID=UPI002378501B|nr:hypothetical protein [Alicyclobacillus sp. ALC3]WDL96718.1 hypothetical protein JC200_20855 [Alicyclobacillus sp. ALC3]
MGKGGSRWFQVRITRSPSLLLAIILNLFVSMVANRIPDDIAVGLSCCSGVMLIWSSMGAFWLLPMRVNVDGIRVGVRVYRPTQIRSLFVAETKRYIMIRTGDGLLGSQYIYVRKQDWDAVKGAVLKWAKTNGIRTW